MKQVYDNNNKSLFSSALMENGVLITDSLDKALIFNEFFATQTILDGADIEITSWLLSAYDFYSRVVKDR